MIATAISLFAGGTEQLSATALDGSGGTVANPPATAWQSANTAVATVSPTGLVTAVANGQTDVTATIGGRKGTTRVTVGAAPLTAVVDMPGNTFAPFTTTIRVNGIVSFRFPATAHNVIFKPGAGKPPDIQSESNVTITRTFSTLGTFAYDCTLHNGMSGEVVVVN
jgi:plastocyanin